MGIALFFQQLLAPLALASGAGPQPASLPLGAGQDRLELAVHRTVEAIFDFTRWPRRPDPVRLCIVGPTRIGTRLDGLHLSDGRQVVRFELPSGADLRGRCDALYLGQLDLSAMRAAAAHVRGAGVVTIAEADPGCRSQAMFCLLPGKDDLSFELNIDAVARSGVAIDPRLLRMSRGR